MDADATGNKLASHSSAEAVVLGTSCPECGRYEMAVFRFVQRLMRSAACKRLTLPAVSVTRALMTCNNDSHRNEAAIVHSNISDIEYRDKQLP